MESPNATITLVSAGAIMSTASRKYQEAVRVGERALVLGLALRAGAGRG